MMQFDQIEENAISLNMDNRTNGGWSYVLNVLWNQLTNSALPNKRPEHWETILNLEKEVADNHFLHYLGNAAYYSSRAQSSDVARKFAGHQANMLILRPPTDITYWYQQLLSMTHPITNPNGPTLELGPRNVSDRIREWIPFCVAGDLHHSCKPCLVRSTTHLFPDGKPNAKNLDVFIMNLGNERVVPVCRYKCCYGDACAGNGEFVVVYQHLKLKAEDCKPDADHSKFPDFTDKWAAAGLCKQCVYKLKYEKHVHSLVTRLVDLIYRFRHPKSPSNMSEKELARKNEVESVNYNDLPLIMKFLKTYTSNKAPSHYWITQEVQHNLKSNKFYLIRYPLQDFVRVKQEALLFYKPNENSPCEALPEGDRMNLQIPLSLWRFAPLAYIYYCTKIIGTQSILEAQIEDFNGRQQKACSCKFPNLAVLLRFPYSNIEQLRFRHYFTSPEPPYRDVKSCNWFSIDPMCVSEQAIRTHYHRHWHVLWAVNYTKECMTESDHELILSILHNVYCIMYYRYVTGLYPGTFNENSVINRTETVTGKNYLEFVEQESRYMMFGTKKKLSQALVFPNKEVESALPGEHEITSLVYEFFYAVANMNQKVTNHTEFNEKIKDTSVFRMSFYTHSNVFKENLQNQQDHKAAKVVQEKWHKLHPKAHLVHYHFMRCLTSLFPLESRFPGIDYTVVDRPDCFGHFYNTPFQSVAGSPIMPFLAQKSFDFDPQFLPDAMPSFANLEKEDSELYTVLQTPIFTSTTERGIVLKTYYYDPICNPDIRDISDPFYKHTWPVYVLKRGKLYGLTDYKPGSENPVGCCTFADERFKMGLNQTFLMFYMPWPVLPFSANTPFTTKLITQLNCTLEEQQDAPVPIDMRFFQKKWVRSWATWSKLPDYLICTARYFFCDSVPKISAYFDTGKMNMVQGQFMSSMKAYFSNRTRQDFRSEVVERLATSDFALNQLTLEPLIRKYITQGFNKAGITIIPPVLDMAVSDSCGVWKICLDLETLPSFIKNAVKKRKRGEGEVPIEIEKEDLDLEENVLETKKQKK